MTDIKTLIDKASKMCGSDASLARKMGTTQSVISDMRHRGRTISPETAIELADIAGEDVQAAAMAAIEIRSAGTRRGQVLKEILGKLKKGAAGGAVAMLLFSNAQETRVAANPVKSLYIVEYQLIASWITIAQVAACFS